jgi:hypothetical protein
MSESESDPLVISLASITEAMSKKPALPSTPWTGTSGTSDRAPPINGGVETFYGVVIPWTGGSRQATTARTEPASIKAYCPNDFKSKRKAEEDCQEGLGTENRLKSPEEILKDADAVLMTDSVFHFMLNGTEVNLFKNYGLIMPE